MMAWTQIKKVVVSIFHLNELGKDKMEKDYGLLGVNTLHLIMMEKLLMWESCAPPHSRSKLKIDKISFMKILRRNGLSIEFIDGILQYILYPIFLFLFLVQYFLH